MKTRTITRQLVTLIACGSVLFAAMAAAADIKPRGARGRPAEVIKDLSEKGQELKAQYSAMMEALGSDIKSSVPAIEEANKAACIEAVKALSAAKNRLLSAEGNLHKNQRAIAGAGVEAAEADLKVAPVRVAKYEDMLEWAQALPDSREDKAKLVEFAENKIRRRTRDLEKAPKAVEKAQARQEKAQANEPKVKAAYQEALDAYRQTLADAQQALDAVALNGLLASNKLDGKLAAFKILSDATPRSLAQFAQQGPRHEKLIERLFYDTDLMVQMAVADGAFWGKYGAAMEIYDAIQAASPRAKEGVFQRMAVAVSLVFAVPMKQENIEADKDAPEYVDPVDRYLSYEKWYLAGELDPAFKDLTTWELKMVINQNVPNEVLAWGRAMLRNFRPDLIDIGNKFGRYIVAVNSEISYGSGDVKLDRDDRHRYQNILANGGICGRRAFFARFLLRSFGIPTTRRPQPGHATTAYWTPDGWQTRLGGNWGGKSWMSISGEQTHNLNFLAVTQARESAEGFLQVKRAQWIGDMMHEERVFGLHGRGGKRSDGRNPSIKKDIGPWYAMSLIKQAEVIEELKAEAAAAGKEFGVASTFKDYIDHPEYQVSAADRKVVVDAAGKITIPAASCKLPDVNLAKSGEMGTHVTLRFMPSNLGGVQLHYGRYSPGLKLTCTFEAPKSGTYELSARVVTPRPDTALTVSVNGTLRELPLPYTTGMWGASEPIRIELKRGQNTLKFWRSSGKGITIRDFTLSPVK